jgi:hypothetical protein
LPDVAFCFLKSVRRSSATMVGEGGGGVEATALVVVLMGVVASEENAWLLRVELDGRC